MANAWVHMLVSLYSHTTYFARHSRGVKRVSFFKLARHLTGNTHDCNIVQDIMHGDILTCLLLNTWKKKMKKPCKNIFKYQKHALKRTPCFNGC